MVRFLTSCKYPYSEEAGVGGQHRPFEISAPHSKWTALKCTAWEYTKGIMHSGTQLVFLNFRLCLFINKIITRPVVSSLGFDTQAVGIFKGWEI